MPTAELRRKSDDTRLPARDLAITTDQDSFCWQLQGTVLDPELARSVAPTSDGMSEVKAVIQGWRFDFIIEGYSVRREHGRITYTIQGRSRTAYLAEPHAPERARKEDSDRDLQQLAADELEFTDIDLTWDATDWHVPGGTWSYRGLTPIRAINRCAEAAGAFLLSDRADDHLTVRPYYPKSPPDWTTDDLPEIAESDILDARERWQNDERHARVWITGEGDNGVAVEVYRPAWDVYDETREAEPERHPLITDPQGGRALGAYTIDRSGPKVNRTVTMPLRRKSEDSDALRLPGDMVALTIDGTTTPALVTSTRIRVRLQDDAPTVHQQLELETREETPE